MSSYAAADFTDEDSSQEEKSSVISSQEEKSSVIGESFAESSNLDSEDNCHVYVASKTPNLTGAVRRSVRNDGSNKQQKNQIIPDSDSSTELNIISTTNKRNSSKRRTSSFRNKSTGLSSPSNSSDTTRKDNIKNKQNESANDHRASFIKSRYPELSSDSDDIVKIKSKKKFIVPDSESDEENLNVLNGSDKVDEVSCSIEAIASDEVDIVTKILNNSRISSVFDFGKKGAIINSTVLDIEDQNTPKAGSKRSFNKSIDTPRVLKQFRESSTPRNNTPVKKIQVQENDPMQTPRSVKEIIPSSASSSSSVEILSGDDEDDIIDVSSRDITPPPPSPPRHLAPKVVKQTTLDSMIVKKKSTTPEVFKEQEKSCDTIEVCPKEMSEQEEKVRKIEVDLHKANNLLRTVNLESLPDKGKLIKDRHAMIEKMLIREVEKMSKMVVSKEDPPDGQKRAGAKVVASWDEIQANAQAVMPRTFGKQALSTYNAQKALTMDSLHQLHGSLKSCPGENVFEKDPGGLKVELMPHQKRALAWLMWREKQTPSGGILADDMGLGKTLTMISLMLKTMEVERDDTESDSENDRVKSSDKRKGGTLVVCPASLLNQWSGELENRTRRGLASYELYHGPKRETKPKRLAEYDMVITTYAIVKNECERKGAVFRVKWRRIIIDEGHQIRNHKCQTSEAVCRLAARSRWALTGTPVHNKELDMYALLKYLRCSPFDDLQVWKTWVGDKSTGGQERLHTVISSLMLRRTKAELMEKGMLKCMPDRKWELIPVDLKKDEMDVYQKILLFSRTLFAQFLHQRAEKDQDVINMRYASLDAIPDDPNQQYLKMRNKLLRFHNVRDIKQHEILVLLLRLRQICCHPSLITNMLHENMDDLDGEEQQEEMNILDQLSRLDLEDDVDDPNSNPAQKDAPCLSEAAKNLLNPSNPVFSKERMSSKIRAVLKVITEKIVKTEDKAVIVSQWPSFLKLIGYHLHKKSIPFDQLDGSIPVHKRMTMVDNFNNPNDKMKILLLSLTAGGVGLNLIGANHLFLLDLHWNPQLEHQAQDRIYRVGQQKPVFVYKFMATDTIEKRILDLQERKLDIANSMLTGTKQVINSKLSLRDLKLLFDM